MSQLALNKYRTDIDGLRAIAVLSVTIFHLNPHWLSGGFLGVDIFFVISGFLITSLLYRDISNDTFSFKTFYTKRIKRILPAFFVVIFVGLALAYTTFMYHDAKETGHAAFASVIFVANFVFSLGGGYFDVASEEKLFLHIWSLSIEEQFYFIVPTFLIILMKFGGGYFKKYILYILTGLLILLMVSSAIDLEAIGIPMDVYYLPHLRFAEMLVGSILAIHLQRHSGQDIIARRYHSGLSVLALLVLCACFIFGEYFKPPVFPGVLSLVPCGATALLLYTNRHATPASWLMSRPMMVWFGKISYSLYLWHWLVLAYIRYFYGGGELVWSLYIVAGVLMLLGSVASYYWVEQPLRHSKLSFGKSVLWLYAIPAIITITWGKTPALLPNKTLPIEVTEDWIKQPGDDSNEMGIMRGDWTKPMSVLVAGDSHTRQLFNFIDIVGQHEGWRAFVAWAPSCPWFFDYTFEFRGQTPGFNEKRLAYLNDEYLNYDTIILANYWGSKYYKQDPEFILALERTLNRLIASGKEIILINTMYKVRTTRQRESATPIIANLMNWATLGQLPLSNEETLGYKQTTARIKSVVDRYPQVRWIDLEPMLPREGMVGETPVFKNPDHINHVGAGYLAEQFIASGQAIKPSR